jgi:hypothetical protein
MTPGSIAGPASFAGGGGATEAAAASVDVGCDVARPHAATTKKTNALFKRARCYSSRLGLGQPRGVSERMYATIASFSASFRSKR